MTILRAGKMKVSNSNYLMKTNLYYLYSQINPVISPLTSVTSLVIGSCQVHSPVQSHSKLLMMTLKYFLKFFLTGTFTHVITNVIVQD